MITSLVGEMVELLGTKEPTEEKYVGKRGWVVAVYQPAANIGLRASVSFPDRILTVPMDNLKRVELRPVQKVIVHPDRGLYLGGGQFSGDFEDKAELREYMNTRFVPSFSMTAGELPEHAEGSEVITDKPVEKTFAQEVPHDLDWDVLGLSPSDMLFLEVEPE